MITISSSAASLKVVLAGVITTNQLSCTATVLDFDTVEGDLSAQSTTLALTNSTTAVTLLPGPTGGYRRQVGLISVFNQDTASATVTVSLHDGTTNYPLIKVTLQAGSTLQYSQAQGWTVLGPDGDTLSVIGAATGTSLAVTAGLTSSGATGAGIGYATGAGGTVTQATSVTTGVTLNKLSGQITTFSQTAAAGVDVSFTLTNSTIAAGDVVVVATKSYGGTADGIPVASVVATAAGSCVINIRNTGAVALDDVVVLNFAVVKAVAA